MATTVKIPTNVGKSDIAMAMHEWVLGLHAERNREILSRRLFDGIPFEQLAEEFELTDRQVKNICYKWTNIIIEHIHK